MTKKQNTLSASRKSRTALRRHRGGNAVIEMVFAFQLLMFISMGMVEFGQYFYIKHAFEGAARDAARAAVLATATSTSPWSAATYTLGEANITTPSQSWMTITDLGSDGTGNTVVANNDVTSIAAGDILQVQIKVNYDQIPNVMRPLYAITGNNFGIKNGKPMVGQCTMVRE